MSNFGKAKKYLTKSEIETRVRELLTQSEITILEQKDQIFVMKTRIEKLQKEVLDLKKREKIISRALFEATEKSRAAFEQSKVRRNEEIERLRDFSAKWSVLLSQKMKVAEVNDFSVEFDEVVSSMKLGIGNAEIARRKELEKARQEMDRANAEMLESRKDIENRYNLVLKKFEKQKKSDDKKGFDFDEALNPTAPLEDIMKEIFVKNKSKK